MSSNWHTVDEERTVNNERTVDVELSKFGVATVGKIDSKLVEKVRDGPLDVRTRGLRQTVLRWNSDCDAIVSDFETRIKPSITTLRTKICQNRRFVFFHEYPTSSGIHKPEYGTGKHTVAIMIRDGPGLPLIYKGSHMSNELDMSALDPPSASSSGEGSVMVFDASIGREDPPVKGVGGASILLLYVEGNKGT